MDAAARLIYERGVAGTTLDDVRATAEVSGSQLSHYFAGKDELVQAVIGHQAGIIAGNQEQADLGTAEGVKAWRDMVIGAARSTGGKGGCPLGSLGGQLAETDPRARTLIADGFARWSAVPPGWWRWAAAQLAGVLIRSRLPSGSRSSISPPIGRFSSGRAGLGYNGVKVSDYQVDSECLAGRHHGVRRGTAAIGHTRSTRTPACRARSGAPILR